MMSEVIEIEEPNYTQIPNVFFDYWMEKFTPGEFKVLMCIARKTFGWGKNTDRISISQIMKMAKLSRQGVVNAVKKLEDLKLVVKNRNQSSEHGCEASTFQIRVFKPKNIQASQLSGQGASQLSRQGLVNSVDSQKNKPSKEKEQQQPTPQKKGEQKANTPVVVVFPFLSDVPGLSQKSAKALMASFTEEQLENACRMLPEDGVPNPFGWLRTCIEEAWESAPTEKERADANGRVLKNVFGHLDGRKIGPFTITIGNTYIEFNAGGNTKAHRFETNHKSFENAVRQFIQEAQKGGVT